jgi:outer membrane protein
MKRIIILLTVISAGVFSAVGQIKVLTFQDAVRIGMQNNVLLGTQRNNLEYSQMQKIASIAGMGPQVTITGTASQFNGNSFNNNTGTVVNGVRDNVQGNISAQLNLFSGFNRINQIKQYHNALDAQAYFVNRTGQDAINTISTQYLQVMLDVELLKIAKQNFEAQDKQLVQIKEQVALGARSPVDEYNQDALTKGAQLRMVQAEITLNNDKTALTQTLLIDPMEQYDVEKPAWDLNALGYDSLDIERLTEQAKLSRGDYLRAVKQEQASRFATAAAKGLMMPTLYAFGSYGSSYNYQHDVPDSVTSTTSTPVIVVDPTQPTGYGIGSVEKSSVVANPSVPRPFAEQFRQNNVTKQYGVQLQINVFNGLQSRTVYKQQKVLYENSQLTRKNLEFQIKNDVIRSVRNFDGARKAYAISVDQLSAAKIAFDLETERYNLGVTNFVDFTNANRVYIQAETDKAQAEYRLVFQRISIEYAVGTLKAEDLEK